MSKNNNRKLQVSLNNLDNITQSTLSFFFKSNLCTKAELNSNNNKIDVFIIDIEREYDKQVVSDLSNNNQYIIFLYNVRNTPILEENTYSVSKPVQAKYLKQQIDFISSRLGRIIDVHPTPTNDNHYSPNNLELINKEVIKKVIPEPKSPRIQKNNHLKLALKESTDRDILNQYKAHKHVGSNKDINPDNPEELKNIYHSPQKYLYYYLAKAVKMGKENKSDVLIKTLFGSLLYEYKSQLFYHGFNSTKIRYFKSSPLFMESKISTISISASAKKIKTATHDATEFIWESAILASKGKLPQGTSLKQVVEMKSWPNFSRLLIFRYTVQITSAWSTHHLSLLETATQLNIPQRYIFTLYNAMLAIESAKINNVIHKVKKINNDKRKSIFSKILSHIFSN